MNIKQKNDNSKQLVIKVGAEIMYGLSNILYAMDKCNMSEKCKSEVAEYLTKKLNNVFKENAENVQNIMRAYGYVMPYEEEYENNNNE